MIRLSDKYRSPLTRALRLHEAGDFKTAYYLASGLASVAMCEWCDDVFDKDDFTDVEIIRRVRDRAMDAWDRKLDFALSELNCNKGT